MVKINAFIKTVLVPIISCRRCVDAMAKHQRRSFATDKSSQPYHDGMHRQSYHQKSKLVTKPNLRYAKNPNKDESRRSRYATIVRNENKSIIHKDIAIVSL